MANDDSSGSIARRDLTQPIQEPGMTSLGNGLGSGSQVPPIDTTMADDDDLLYGDQDDAQSFIQPIISPVATRLMFPKTPVAEKAAAMDESAAGFFDSFSSRGSASPPVELFTPAPLDSPTPPNSWIVPPRPTFPGQSRGSGPKLGEVQSSKSQVGALPSPWRSEAATKPALSGVFGQSRHSRSSSVGADALKRLSKALPSISIPSGLLPSLSTPSFFSSTSFQKSTSQAPTTHTATISALPASIVKQTTSPVVAARTRFANELPGPRPGIHRPPSITSRRSLALRRSISDDSLLYNSLSRVSSFGDDARFENIREQVNSRFKAIRDSFPDVPTFKLPQLPNLFPAAPVKTSLNGPDISRSHQRSSLPSRVTIPLIDQTLESLSGDVVVLGGYRGSVLRSAEAPFRQLWVPVKVGLNIRKVNLELGLNPEDEENAEKTIFASGMLQNIGPVDISKRLFKKLRECDNARNGRLRVHDYGYDWRLSPHLQSRKFIKFLEGLPSNQPGTPKESRGALIIAHSLGGLITRHAVNRRPELFGGVIYAGTPLRCVNILGPIRNGDAVLLNEKVLTAQVNFSLRTSFALLPDDGFCFINKDTKEEYPVDFYNVDDWVKYRWSPCIEPVLPPFNRRTSTFGSLLDISGSLSSLPLRSRSGSESKKSQSPTRTYFADAMRMTEVAKDRALAPQLDSSSTQAKSSGSPPRSRSESTTKPSPQQGVQRAKCLEYLTRTLAETKQFRAETAHLPQHTSSNIYPPLAVLYGKDIPTVYAAQVTSREAIACADAYDELTFRSGDGVVLAREAMLPPGYDLVKGGRVSTDRGHVGLLGDLVAVGKALEAVVRGRKKGIGLGPGVLDRK